MKKQPDNIELLLDSNRGIYIPRDFVEGFDLEEWHVNVDNAYICKNPDHEFYWDSWAGILNNAYYIAEDGRKFTLYQDGDLWALCLDQMTQEEKANFGFDD